MTENSQNLTNPSVVARVLEENGLKLYKGLGQNFLIDGNTRGLIVKNADLKSQDKVLEIGGGIGTLTQAVVPRVARVVVVEIDRKFAPIIRETLRGFDNLDIVNRDIMKLDIRRSIEGWGINKIVSNLPYNIATPLIMDILEQASDLIELMVLMVQREVAERLTTTKGSSAYGTVTVLMGLLSSIKMVHAVGKKVFIPQPKVDSSIIKISPLKEPRDYPLIKEVVKTAFSQRRKKAAKLLASRFLTAMPEMEILFEVNGIEKSARAQDISPEEYVKLTKSIREATT